MTCLKTFGASLLFAFVLQSGAQASPIVFDAGAEFSFSNNPNLSWSYGYTPALGVAFNFNAYTQTATAVGVQFWRNDASNFGTPNVGLNPTGSDITFASTTFRPNQLTLHPGPNGELSVVRFIAPTSGAYSLTSLFNMRSFGGSHSTDVHVLLNNVEQFTDVVATFDDQKTFNSALGLASGDVLDFVVGANNDFLGDTTELRARLEYAPTQVPEPWTAALFATAVGLLAMMRRRTGR